MQPPFPPFPAATAPPRLRAALTALLDAALDECAALDDLERIGYGTLTLDVTLRARQWRMARVTVAVTHVPPPGTSPPGVHQNGEDAAEPER